MLAGLIALGCRPTAYGFTSHSPTLRRGSHRCPPLVDRTIIPVAKTRPPGAALRRCLLLLVALVLPHALRAQDSASVDTTQWSSPQRIDSVLHPVGSLPDSGSDLIQHVEIRRSDVFDSAETKNWITRLVNGLHIVTSQGVVHRELLLHEGEPWDSSRAAETARNLRRLGVFRKVSVDSVRSDSGLTMLVQTKDGWSTQADVRFRSTGGQTDWQVMMAERNLLGTASRFAVRYRHTPDRSLLNFNFLNPRLIAHQVSLGLNYQHRSDGDRFIAAVERPFYSLEDRRGISTLFDFRNERVLQYFDGVPTAGDSLRRRYVLAGVEAAKAIQRSTAGYIRVGLNGQVRRDDYSTWPQDTSYAGVTGTLGTFVEYRRANFAITRGFRSFGQDEDIDLSNFVRFGVYAAPELFGYDKGGVGALLMARFGTQLPFGFAWLDARVNGVQTSAGLDSGSVVLGATSVLRPMARHMAILHADIGWLKDPLPGSEFDLGFAIGPRAFPIHAFTGDRSYFATAEYRINFVDDLFKVLALGAAAFVDHGGAWYAGAPKRNGTDVGLGIRLAPSRAADANTTRMDLAYRFDNGRLKSGWVFVFASGLVFSTSARGGGS